MAANIPSTALLPRTIHLGLSTFSRKAIEHQIEALIDLLDKVDGDEDLEDDELHDDICDRGEPVEYTDTLPRYGADQSVGPVNELEMYNAQQRADIRMLHG